MPTETLLRRPASVTPPGVARSRGARAARPRRRRAGGPSGSAARRARASNTSVRHRHEVRVRHPGAVEAVAGLALLVLAHLRERDCVDLGVAPAGDERRHAADGVRAAAVAGLHQQLGVGAHERHRHRHLGAVRQHEVGPVPELLDDAEDVVPAAGVQPGRVLAQLVEDLVHLERGEDGLDQDGGADGAARDAERVLRVDEHVVPEPRFEMALELRQVEVRAPPRAVRCGRSRGRSRRGSPTIGAPSTSKCLSTRCQPRGRTSSVATLSFSR